MMLSKYLLRQSKAPLFMNYGKELKEKNKVV